MVKIELEPPLRVSPFIRFARWSFLLAGIWYGSVRFRRLQRKENEERAYIEKMKPVWMEEKKKILTGRNREELLYLARETGTKIPANFDQEYPAYTPAPK